MCDACRFGFFQTHLHNVCLPKGYMAITYFFDFTLNIPEKPFLHSAQHYQLLTVKQQQP
jgi:hypothetical protein